MEFNKATVTIYYKGLPENDILTSGSYVFSLIVVNPLSMIFNYFLLAFRNIIKQRVLCHC